MHTSTQDETLKMYIWGYFREVPRLSYSERRNSNQPRQSQSHFPNAPFKKIKRIVRFAGKVDLYRATHLKFVRNVLTFHKTLEKRHAFHLGSSLLKCL